MAPGTKKLGGIGPSGLHSTKRDRSAPVSFFSLLVGLMLCLSPDSALSAEPGAERLLVLSVTMNGHPDQKLAQALLQYLGRSGEALVEAPRLSSAERQCKDQACLDAIGARTTAALIVFAEIKESDEESSLVRVWLFDRNTAQADEEQVVCETPQVEQKLKERVALLLQSHRTPPEPAARPALAAPAASVADSAPSATESTERRRVTLPVWRKAVAGALGGAAALALTAAVTLTLYHHDPAGGSCPYQLNGQCVWNFEAAYASSYAATGALLAGAGLTLILP